MAGRGSKAWNEGHYVTVYSMARDGCPIVEISHACGVEFVTFNSWLENKPYFREALEKGRSFHKKNDGIVDMVYGRLPADLREVWDRLKVWDCSKVGQQHLDTLMDKLDVQQKQRLFIHLTCTGNFSMTEAAAKLYVTHNTIKSWLQNSKTFRALYDGIEQVKKDFIEAALMQGIKDGNERMIIFASSTKNRDRGYGPSVRIDGKINHQHTHEAISTSEVFAELDDDTAMKVLEAMKRVENRKKLAAIEVKAEPVALLEGPKDG